MCVCTFYAGHIVQISRSFAPFIKSIPSALQFLITLVWYRLRVRTSPSSRELNFYLLLAGRGGGEKKKKDREEIMRFSLVVQMTSGDYSSVGMLYVGGIVGLA